MRALGVDTTTRSGSLALCEDDRVVGTLAGDPLRTHGVRLVDDLDRLLRQHGWRPQDVDVYGVAAGPGSFTGLRIGIATVQGLAMVHDRPVVAVSALEALARAAAPDALRTPAGNAAPLVAAWIDGHRGEVFGALYHVEPERAGPLEVAGPTVESPCQTLERWDRQHPATPILFAGDGALRYRADIVRILEGRAMVLERVPLTAPAVAAIALEAAALGTAGPPSAVRPLYVRRPDVELVRDATARRT